MTFTMVVLAFFQGAFPESLASKSYIGPAPYMVSVCVLVSSLHLALSPHMPVMKLAGYTDTTTVTGSPPAYCETFSIISMPSGSGWQASPFTVTPSQAQAASHPTTSVSASCT